MKKEKDDDDGICQVGFAFAVDDNNAILAYGKKPECDDVSAIKNSNEIVINGIQSECCHANVSSKEKYFNKREEMHSLVTTNLGMGQEFENGGAKTETRNQDKDMWEMEKYNANPSICSVCGECCQRDDVLIMHLRYTHGIDTGFGVTSDGENSYTHVGTDAAPISRIQSATSVFLKDKANNLLHDPTEMTPNKKTLKKHHKCNYCSKTFRRPCDLMSHMRIHTGEKPYKCNMCDKPFADSSNMKVHMRRHTEEKPYNCSMCDRKFSNFINMTVHTRTHTGEKPYTCSMCDKRFTDGSNMRAHMRIHTEEKPYKCSMCDKTFKHASSVKVHIKTHTGEKPYTCSICNKSFTRSGDIDRHMRIHTGEKPFKCSLCDKTFSDSSNFRVHKLRHKGKPYKCNMCDQTFSHPGYRKRHMHLHTKM